MYEELIKMPWKGMTQMIPVVVNCSGRHEKLKFEQNNII